MAIQIVPYAQEHEREAKAFNDRLRAKNQIEFLLSERAVETEPQTAAIRNFYSLALEDGTVRGGLLLASYPAAFGDGEDTVVLNAREPLSEGLIDSKYSLLALRLLKHMQAQSKYLFALGMGSEEARFTRLLRGAGWTIKPVPFFFRVLRAGRFLRELQLLRRSSTKRLLARIAAVSGTGKLGVSALQWRSVQAAALRRDLRIESAAEWGDWADELWQRFRPHCSFGVRRNATTLRELYRIGQDRSQLFVLKRGGQPVGWITTQNSQMQSHNYFGSMQVATILDGVCEPESMAAAASLATKALGREGADLVVANFSHADWRQALRSAGFLTTRSNYILATNKALTEDAARQPGSLECLHFTRGDGDGRGHL